MLSTSNSFIISSRWCSLLVGKGRLARFLTCVCAALYLALMVSSCALPGQTQSQPPDPRLKLFHVLSTRILTLDSQAEVDGTIINTDTYKYPFDVSLVATFYDLHSNVIGQATGIAEDVWPGTTRPFTLEGQVDTSKYSRMVVVPVSLRERRIERNLPTPPPVIP